jgi:hypothetical protein
MKKWVPTNVPWAEARLNADLAVCFNISGDSCNEGVSANNFLTIELPPRIGVFVIFNLLQNLVDCPHLEHLVHRRFVH